MGISYLEIIQEQGENILGLYRQFEDKNPVMVFDLHENMVYAFPYEGILKQLNQKSRQALVEQYERAQAGNSVVVFIRDTEQGQMVSYTISLEEAEED